MNELKSIQTNTDLNSDMVMYASQLISNSEESITKFADAPFTSSRSINTPVSIAHAQTMLDNATDGIFCTTLDGSIIYANSTLSNITGYSSDLLMGETFSMWLNRDIASDVLASIWTAMYDGIVWVGELSGASLFGESLDLQLKLTPIIQNNQPTGYVGVLTDITKHKEVERLKAQFISNVSHELRTPLTNLKTYITLLERGDSTKSEKYVQTIKNETIRLGKVIDDIMSLSRFEMSSDSSSMSPIDIVELIENVTHTYRLEAAYKAITITLNRPEQKLAAMFADGSKLHTAFANILQNAVNFTEIGGEISVRLSQSKIDGRNVAIIKIADNGVGVSEAEHGLIFDQFYRGAAAADGKIPGTGLGLSMANQIVKAYNGSIGVESQLNKGTTFTVVLPID